MKPVAWQDLPSDDQKKAVKILENLTADQVFSDEERDLLERIFAGDTDRLLDLVRKGLRTDGDLTDAEKEELVDIIDYSGVPYDDE